MALVAEKRCRNGDEKKDKRNQREEVVVVVAVVGGPAGTNSFVL